MSFAPFLFASSPKKGRGKGSSETLAKQTRETEKSGSVSTSVRKLENVFVP